MRDVSKGRGGGGGGGVARRTSILRFSWTKSTCDASLTHINVNAFLWDFILKLCYGRTCISKKKLMGAFHLKSESMSRLVTTLPPRKRKVD